MEPVTKGAILDPISWKSWNFVVVAYKPFLIKA